jgi:hypothetical protein
MLCLIFTNRLKLTGLTIILPRQALQMVSCTIQIVVLLRRQVMSITEMQRLMWWNPLDRTLAMDHLNLRGTPATAYSLGGEGDKSVNFVWLDATKINPPVNVDSAHIF